MTKYVLPKILNLDELFSTTPNAITINQYLLNRTKEETIEILCDISNDREDTVASCDCGKISGNYYDGTYCRQCSTHCQQNLFGKIKNDMWLSIPVSIKKVLNPQIYLMLARWMGTVKRKSIIELIIDRNEPRELIKGTPFYAGMGFNWFYENFDQLVTFFASKKKGGDSFMIDLLNNAGDAIWCTKLPMMSKLIQPITTAQNSRYADPDIKSLIKAIFTMGSMMLAEQIMHFNEKKIDCAFITVYLGFIEYVSKIISEKLPKKPSILRKHVFGSRYHCTGRSVAIPIIQPHEHDDIYLPWKLGIMMYKYHIITHLTKRYNVPLTEAYGKVTRALTKYDFDIDVIMQQLIGECPYKGLPILVNRNPSLRIAAIQLLYVVKIKPSLSIDPYSSIIDNGVDVDQINDTVNRYIEDGTIGVSPMITKGPNLDFDGDELNLMPIFEMSEVEQFNLLRPEHRYISNRDICIDADDVTISNQQFTILNGWMQDAL